MTVLQKERSDIRPSERLKDMVAVVTGAGSGIGRAAALRLAGEGAKVCLVDLKDTRTKQVKQEIESLGGQAVTADSDVSDPQRVEQAVKLAVGQWGRLDIVFANAGINGTLAPIEEMSTEEWDHTLSTNLKGTFLAVKYAIPHMKERGGSIIVTSSVNGNRVFSGFGIRLQHIQSRASRLCQNGGIGACALQNPGECHMPRSDPNQYKRKHAPDARLEKHRNPCQLSGGEYAARARTGTTGAGRRSGPVPRLAGPVPYIGYGNLYRRRRIVIVAPTPHGIQAGFPLECLFALPAKPYPAVLLKQKKDKQHVCRSSLLTLSDFSIG
jgi:NAD(P)-dependent dehydrogenase (short-subunit alcohol dehydrogenase family)